MQADGILDEAYQRLQGTGPEFEGWLSNHGPMAADALVRLGHGDRVDEWVTGYCERLEEAPRPRWPIAEDEWREPLGDPSRLGDWLRFFERALGERPWSEVLVAWWPRLLPGALASATHGLIRTGHAVRALREAESPARAGELAQALGYWAARWQPVPARPAPAGTAAPAAALAGLPVVDRQGGPRGGGGARSRAAALSSLRGWPADASTVAPAGAPEDVAAHLDALVDAAVAGYERWGHGNPVMLVHAATAPRAASLVVPALPSAMWQPTFDAAWAVSAAITSMYRPATDDSGPGPDDDLDDLVAQAAANGDEHLVKFTEVAVEAHRRGAPGAVPALTRAVALFGAA